MKKKHFFVFNKRKYRLRLSEESFADLAALREPKVAREAAKHAKFQMGSDA